MSFRGRSLALYQALRAAIPAIYGFLYDQDAAARFTAVGVLATFIVYSSFREALETAIPGLVSILRCDDDPGLRYKAAASLDKFLEYLLNESYNFHFLVDFLFWGAKNWRMFLLNPSENGIEPDRGGKRHIEPSTRQAKPIKRVRPGLSDIERARTSSNIMHSNDFGIWAISSKLFFTRKACKLAFTLKLKSVKIQVLKPFKMCLHASTLWVLQWQSFAASKSLKLDLILRNIKRRK
ncbi:hypothetical protein B0H14DRAFT_2642759 [Mycena olivaceomarginata]|nr:hypothetical protein B0H14DRAFT_2642759 [Mycena olivaceomarginata]